VEILHKWLMIGGRVDNYSRGIVFYWLYKNGAAAPTLAEIQQFVTGKQVMKYKFPERINALR